MTTKITKLTQEQITDLFIKIYKEKGSIRAAQDELKYKYHIELSNQTSRDYYPTNLTDAARSLLENKNSPSQRTRFVKKGAKSNFWEKEDWVMIYEQRLLIKLLKERGLSEDQISQRLGWSVEFVKLHGREIKNKQENPDVDAFKMIRDMGEGNSE